MNVLHLISSGGMYGAEAVILGLSHALVREGNACTVGVFANASLALYDRAQAEELPALQIACSSQADPSTLRAIRDAVQRTGCDVLHAHGYKADLYARLALRKRPIAMVSTCHTWYDNNLALRLYGALDRWALRGFQRVVAVSAEVEERLLASGVKRQRIRQIRNGVALPAQPVRDRSADSLSVGLVGRLSHEKGVDVFVRAAALVLRDLPGTRFTVFGDGPEREMLQALVRSLGIQQSFHLAGRTENMAQVYAGLDLLVSASRQEGLPMALLEGMATGLPVVGTLVGEVPTLVRDGESGLLVAPDEPQQLAQAMLALLRDDALRRSAGTHARERITQAFSVEHMAQCYRAVYDEALAEVRGA